MSARTGRAATVPNVYADPPTTGDMFEKSTWIRLPRNVVVGHGVLDRVVEAVDDLYLAGRPLLVTSPTPNEIAGKRVAAQFEAAGVEPATTVVEDASFSAVEEVIATAREADADFLIGIGGGKPIDIAKMAADELDLALISVPTAASHDGIVSGRGSVPEGDTRHSVAADPPLAVVADTELLAAAPWRLTTAGCADIISNYTAVKDWQLAHRLKNVEYSEYAGALSRMTAEMLVESADSIKQGLEESAWIVVKALVSSGVAMSIAGSSRPASGAEHLISHQLDRIAPGAALHGHQVGVASLVTEYLHSGADGEWRSVRSALENLGAPTSAAALGIDDADFLEAVTTAHAIRDRYTILGNGVDERAAYEAATTTGVVERE
jgi:glycerol-1-phosphate dehydrogenase [NAD(P)+]